MLLAVTLLLPRQDTATRPPQPFDEWLNGVRAEALTKGISEATLDRALTGLEPLEIVIQRDRSQAELVKTLDQYLKEHLPRQTIVKAQQERLAHATLLKEISEKYGVPQGILIAIWGIESNFGRFSGVRPTIATLATLAYDPRRSTMFRAELFDALKILDSGDVAASAMRGSWAGALGQPQFMPSSFMKFAVDANRDGKRDIWRSVPDALAAAARQLVGKGWQRGVHWAYEVRAPQSVDCTIGVPEVTRPLGEWLKQGYVLSYGRKPAAAELNEPASLLLPEGTYGPAFLTLKNYYVIKEYNFSDLYVLFVGHLSDRISDPRPFETPWSKNTQLRTAQVETMQRTLTKLGLYKDKIDGKAGMLTRSALGAYQKANRIKVDCWPTAAVLEDMQRRAAKD
jgi:lytic murein transglycosylase